MRRARKLDTCLMSICLRVRHDRCSRVSTFRVGDGHLRSVRGRTFGDCGTNAARAARNECNLSFQFLWHRPSTLRPVIKEIERAGGKAITIQADAADARAGKTAVEKTVASFGRLDVLVNNAGMTIPNTFEETTVEEMVRVLDINVRGVFVATQVERLLPREHLLAQCVSSEK